MIRVARTGRLAREDTTPGKILVLGLLANAPIFVGFVVVLLFSGGDTTAARRFAPLTLWGTPFAAVLALGIYRRAPAQRRAHRASRMGALLAGIALVLWMLILIPTLRG